MMKCSVCFCLVLRLLKKLLVVLMRLGLVVWIVLRCEFSSCWVVVWLKFLLVSRFFSEFGRLDFIVVCWVCVFFSNVVSSFCCLLFRLSL